MARRAAGNQIQVGLAHRLAAGEFRGQALKLDLAAFQNEGVGGDLQRHFGILFDQHHVHAFRRDVLDDLRDGVDDGRGKPDRGFVEQQ